MKYWRGYLVAAILAIFTWALTQFAAAHSQLLDMVYPYMSRLIQSSLAQWSGGLDYCVWQALFLFGIGAILASVVLMVALRWNPVQWFGWVLAAVMLVNFASTSLYHLNAESGSIAQDVRISTEGYTQDALEEAALYYLGNANRLSTKVSRDKNGQVKSMDFEAQAQQAADGFVYLVKVEHYPVFAGSTEPVKKLNWSGYYTDNGITGKTVGLTGEAAVNPQVPAAAMPFAMCKEMACRMSIVREGDARFASFMACAANSDENFQYSGWLMAFRECYNALKKLDDHAGQAALRRVESQIGNQVEKDLKTVNKFLGGDAKKVNKTAVNLLVNWHIETVILPLQQEAESEQQITLFDPMDETDPRLSGLLGNDE